MVPVFDSYFNKLSKHLNKPSHYLLLLLIASVWLLIILCPSIPFILDNIWIFETKQPKNCTQPFNRLQFNQTLSNFHRHSKLNFTGAQQINSIKYLVGARRYLNTEVNWQEVVYFLDNIGSEMLPGCRYKSSQGHPCWLPAWVSNWRRSFIVQSPWMWITL